MRRIWVVWAGPWFAGANGNANLRPGEEDSERRGLPSGPMLQCGRR